MPPRIKPAVVEVESHPYHPQWELHEYCETEGIVLLAFAPLGHAIEPRLLDDPLIVSIAARVDRTPAQVLLAWGIQRGTAVLTSSVNPATHQRELRHRPRFPRARCRRSASACRPATDSIQSSTRENPGFLEVPQGS